MIAAPCEKCGGMRSLSLGFHHLSGRWCRCEKVVETPEMNSEYRILLAIRWRIADLLHLLQFAEITTPSPGDAKQAERIMGELRAILNPTEEA